MAVIVLKHAEKYAGTHAERLAMDVSRVSLGSTFFEWDTSELFTFSPTGWVDKIGQVAGSMQLSGSKVAEQKTQADAMANVITFTGDINAVEIYHEESTWQDFIVNGITLKIPSGGYRTPITGTVAKTVTIPANIDCIVGRLS